MKKPEETISLYISDMGNYTLKQQPINITFTDPNTREYLGEFYEEGGELKFTGNVNESAKVFVEFICKSFNERIKQERQEMIDALNSAFLLLDDKPIPNRTNREERLYRQIKTALRNAGVTEES